MPHPKLTLPLTVLALGLGLAGVIATSKPAPQPGTAPVQSPPQVSVIDVRPTPGTVTVRSQGVVRPRRRIELAAQVAGVVVDVDAAFAAGGRFVRGTPLLRIDDRDYVIALTRAKARLADAQQALATERGRARQARQEWRELGDPEANALFLREPQLANAEAQVAAARAEVEQAELDLERTVLRAPFAGRVAELAVDLGQYVAAGSTTATLFATDSIEVPLSFSDRQRGLLDWSRTRAAEGLPVTLHAEVAGRQARWPAVIRRTAAQIDPQTRLLTAIAEVNRPAPGGSEPPLIGQFVEARVPSRRFDSLLTLPARALRPGDRIWTVDTSQRLQIEAVTVLENGADQVTVRTSTAGERQVVTSYLAQPVDGMPVRLAPQPPGAAP